MPLAAVKVLGSVVAAGPPLSVVSTLWLSTIAAVGSSRPPDPLPYAAAQGRVHVFPGAIESSDAEEEVNGLPTGEIMRHEPPCFPGTEHIPDGIEDLAPDCLAGHPPSLGRGIMGSRSDDLASDICNG
jgi:hypothetical protein